MITPYGRKVSEAEREKREREKYAINSGHLFPRQRTQAALRSPYGYTYDVGIAEGLPGKCICQYYRCFLFLSFLFIFFHKVLT